MMVLPLGRLLPTGVTLRGPNDLEGDIGAAEAAVAVAELAGDMDNDPTLMTLVGQRGAEGVDVVVMISWSAWFCKICSGLATVVLDNGTGPIWSADAVGGSCSSCSSLAPPPPTDLWLDPVERR